ncbi:hypothetical protein AM499_13540 [Bacillus sp. FJAT-22090]|uniref:hypothetical protein n=1 Tax=Bacillus sp. FJAT-22090 TaxID=1581038 RepID=UPI0006AFCF10|nr:hypothetical protein [Bacillus sp. FJAT-22090]ALC86735.1 hypothetical protein AM499_13540 [Bacillus sp. FJAT-22090]
MKAKHVWFFMLIFISLFVTACTKNEVEGNEVKKNDIDTKVRNVVVEYFKQKNSNQLNSVNEWENASVKIFTADETYKNLDESYIGKEIFVVTKVDALAAPLVFVDPNTLEVIGIMPGE